MEYKKNIQYQALTEILKGYKKVAVAYSGGVDSTLLAYTACHTLGSENVLILTAESCLLARSTVIASKEIIKNVFPDDARFQTLYLDLLSEEAFVKNKPERCYICKKYIYQALIKEMKREDFHILVDGTNLDDLGEDRPGMKAIGELNVRTPLVEAGIDKAAIRFLAGELGLPNFQLPANSCLATRIGQDTKIEKGLLEKIEVLEAYLVQKKYQGCRVKPRGRAVIVEVQEKDISRLLDSTERTDIIRYFKESGYTKVLLDIAGRGELPEKTY